MGWIGWKGGGERGGERGWEDRMEDEEEGGGRDEISDEGGKRRVESFRSRRERKKTTR